MKILIADDSQTHRYWLQETLIELGHDVTTTCDGQEAWQALSQKTAPQLVILDWIMPEMNGVEVCRKFRETFDSKPTYIILLTGKKKSKENLIEGLQAGADDYLTKPIDPDELRARLQSAMRVLELQSSLVDYAKELEQEIAERKRVESALRESKARYKTLFEQANDAILLEDGNEKIVDVNHRTCQLLGYTRKELLSMKTSDLEAKGTHLRPPRQIDSSSNVAPDAAFETLALHRNGTQIPIEVTLAPLTERDDKLFLSIVRDITERKQVEQFLQRRNKELTALNTVAQALSMTLQLDKLLERVLDGLQQVIPYDAASVSLLHTANIPNNGTRSNGSPTAWPVASRGLDHPFLQGLALEKLPLVQQIVDQRGPVIFPNGHHTSESPPHIENVVPSSNLNKTPKELVRSWLGVPLISKNRVIGVMLIGSHYPDAYNQDAARLAFAFSHQVALAIDNSRLYEQTHAHLRETLLLHNVTAALSSTLDMNQMLPYVARSLCEALNSTSVEIYKPDTEQNTITIIADYGSSDFIGEAFYSNIDQTYPLTNFPAAAEVLDKSRPKQIRIDDSEIGPHDQANLRAHDAQAALLLPMAAHGNTMGLAVVWESQAPRRFTQGETATGQTLTHQAAIALDHARLFSETQRQVNELQLLHNVSLATASGIRLEDALQAAAEALASALRDTRVAIMLIDSKNNTLRIEASVGYPIEEVHNLSLSLDEGISGWVAQHGKPLIVPDVRLEPRYYEMNTDIRSELCVPLATGPFIIGVLNVASPRLDAFTNDDLRLLSTLSSNLAVLVERVRLFTEVAIARAELQQRAEALEDANARLQELDRLKDQFLANMSHELRTPLNSIIGLSDVLLKGMIGEMPVKQEKCVQDILTSGEHLMALINDILDLSKIEAGHMTLEPVAFKTGELLADVQATIAPMIEKKSQTLVIEPINGLPPLTADRFRIKQVLLNLLSNANKFTPNKGTITLSCHQTNPSTTIFSVTDTGVGIKPEDQKVIFEKFCQAGDASAKVNGTGLGLNISRRLVEMHGGRIWLESEYGHGTAFSFSLPNAGPINPDN
ncbi:MAG: GAF domain-containing protein [Chloroflexi bacterium]|nr:GAF domain-containing protein [Chloroflexota bacterium]